MRNQFYARHGRAGITLVEVLVAIFIVGIGLLALLALFPLGMVEMAQAIKDDRQSQLQDVADDLFAESQGLEGSVNQAREIYVGWLKQRRADADQHAALVLILQAHDDEFARITQKVRARLANLSQSDRRLAQDVLRLLRDGRALFLTLQRNLALVQKVQAAIDQVGNPNES